MVNKSPRLSSAGFFFSAPQSCRFRILSLRRRPSKLVITLRKNSIDKQKHVGSVGSVGSICKDCCFIRIISLGVNQQSPVLNQQTLFSCWFSGKDLQASQKRALVQ
jgi:hypothetical protein